MSSVESIVPEATAYQAGSTPAVSDDRTGAAERVIQDHVLLAVASGLVPGPGLDLVAAFTVQLTLLKRLSSVYDIPFRQDAAKSAVTALFGTLGGAGAAAIASASFLKFIPVVGTAVGVAGTSVSFGAFTYAIGKVFQRHFESGGNFIDLDPRAYREYFRELNTRGRKIAAEKKEEVEEANKEAQSKEAQSKDAQSKAARSQQKAASAEA